MFPPPPPIKRIVDILAELNSRGDGVWIVEPGYFAIATPRMSGPVVDFNFPSSGIVLKAFVNMTTGEVKTYVAKWLDIPEQDRINLWALNPPVQPLTPLPQIKPTNG